MMVRRTGGKRGGNLELEREIGALGETRKEKRIRVSIGSTDIKHHRRANAIVDKLIEAHRFDVLRALRDGEITVPELIESDRDGKPARSLASIRLRAYLWDRIVAGVDGDTTEPGAISRAIGKVKGARTRGRYLQSFKALQTKAEAFLPVDAKVIDLVRVPWEDLYDAWGASNADWMHLRRALSRFATLYTGDKWSKFARKLRQVVPAKKVKKRRPNLPISRFKTIIESAPPHAAAAYWVLAITGVRVGEYLASTKANLDRETRTYTVPGAAKNEVGDFPLRVDERWWIYLERGIPSRLRYKWLNIHWTRACKAAGVEGVTMHDLRHCHGQWAIDAKVAESKVQGSLRHENPAQTRDYVMQAGVLDVSTALADAILGTAVTPPKKGKRPA